MSSEKKRRASYLATYLAAPASKQAKYPEGFIAWARIGKRAKNTKRAPRKKCRTKVGRKKGTRRAGISKRTHKRYKCYPKVKG